MIDSKKQSPNTFKKGKTGQKNSSLSTGPLNFLTQANASLRKKEIKTRSHINRPIKPKFENKKKLTFAKKPLSKKDLNRFCLISIKQTKNNIHCTIANLFGNQKTLWSISGGQITPGGPNGRRKTRFTKRMIFKVTTKKLLAFGFQYIVFQVRGNSASKRYIFKNFYRRFKILLLKDLTNIPHNGCRAPKARRL